MTTSEHHWTWEEAVESLRSCPEKEKLVRDCYYDDPVASAAHRYWQSDEWCSIREFLPKVRGKALDVGAGRGIASYALAREGFDVTALEPDPSSIVGAAAIKELAENTGISIEITEEFSEKLPFEDKSFDLVFARAVLHHTQDLEEACREFLRVLKPGGIFIGVREHVISKPSDLKEFFTLHPLHSLYGGENAFLLKRYVEAIIDAGFDNLKTISPWRSAMNYAPHTANSLKRELAFKIARGSLKASLLVRLVLDLPGVWRIVRLLLEKIDNRPGRLYSFVAERK